MYGYRINAVISPIAALFLADGDFDGLLFESADFTFISTGFVGDIFEGEPVPDFSYSALDFLEIFPFIIDIDISGNWDIATFDTWDTLVGRGDNGDLSVIPVPAAVWLFGTALLGMAGFSRRKKVKI